MKDHKQKAEKIYNINEIKNANFADTIIYNGDKKIPKHLGTIPTFPELFIGRENEVEAVHKRLTSQQNILLLVNGKGGIGKTTLASKYYYQYQDYYQHLVWVFSGTSIVDALLTLALPLGVEFPPKMPNEERFTVLLKAMAELNEPCLLIMDNANEITDIEKYHGALLQCSNFHILLTTRVNTKIHNTEIYQVKPLTPEAALQLFTKHYDTHNTNENDLFFSIYEAVNRNTLVVELLAKNLANFNNGLEQEYSLSRLLENINDSLLKLDKSEKVGTFYHAQNGIQRKETPENIIAAMYDLSRLNEIEKRLLSIFSVLPAESISYATLKDLITQDRLDKHLLGLFEKGWLDYDENRKSFRISPVVQEVVRFKSESLYEDYNELVLNLILYLDYIPGINYIFNNDELSIIYSKYAENIIINILSLNVNDEIISGLTERVGVYYQVKGNLNKSLVFYEYQAMISINLYNHYKDNDSLIGLSVAYNKLGEVLQDLGRYDEALIAFTNDKTTSEFLCKKEPDEEQYKANLAVTFEKLGDFYPNIGDLKSALKYHTDSYNIRKLLNDKNSNNETKYLFAVSNSKIGEIYTSLGNFTKSLTYHEIDKLITLELSNKNPKEINYKIGLCLCYQNIGDNYLKMDKIDKALENFIEYNKIIKKLFKTIHKKLIVQTKFISQVL